MNTHSLTQTSPLLKVCEFLQAHFLGTSTPLQEDLPGRGNSSSTQPAQAFRQLQKTYSLERRCFL